jgi:hypothetical protein
VKKKYYLKPEVIEVVLDNSITLLMASNDPPVEPPQQGSGSRGPGSDPFASPYGDKPFK